MSDTSVGTNGANGGGAAGSTPPAAGGRRQGRLVRTGDVLLVLAVALAVLLPGIAALPVVDGEEARLVEASRQMVASGDLLGIRTPDEPGDPGPVLARWLQWLAVTAMGTGPDAPLWIHRLPSLAGAVLAVLLTYATGVLLAGRAAGLTAALLATATVLLGVEARLAGPDAILLATVTAAGWSLAAVWTAETPSRALGRNAVFWTALGLGLLAKGPAILLVVLPVLAAMLLADRSLARIRALDPLKGIAWTALIVVPWWVGVGLVAEDGFSAGVLGVLTGEIAGAPPPYRAPPGSHLLVAIVTFWPLSAFLPLVFAMPALSRLTAPTRRAVVFLSAWILPGWIAVEAIPAKLPDDVLPFLPAVALLVGIAASAVVEPARRWSVRIGYGYVAAGVAILAFGLNAVFVVVEGHADPAGIVVGLVAVMIAFAAAWFLLHGRFAAGVGATVLAAAFAVSLGLAVLLPHASQLRLADRLAEALEAAAPCEAPLVLAAVTPAPDLRLRLGRDARFVDSGEAAGLFAGVACAVALVPAEEDAAFRAATGAGEPAAVVTGRSIDAWRPRTFAVHARGG